jgi:hypothetical protein
MRRQIVTGVALFAVVAALRPRRASIHRSPTSRSAAAAGAVDYPLPSSGKRLMFRTTQRSW